MKRFAVMSTQISLSALEDLRRFRAYGWLPGPIAHVLNRRHGLCLTAAEVKQLCRELSEREPGHGAETRA